MASKGNRLIKSKRNRQPNWTIAEKEFLMTLVKRHSAVLVNEGNSRRNIKKMSDAWDDIASNMLTRGYNHSKERLKQQYNRIKVAEAKRAKEALQRGMLSESKYVVGPKNSSTENNVPSTSVDSAGINIPQNNIYKPLIKSESPVFMPDGNEGSIDSLDQIRIESVRSLYSRRIAIARRRLFALRLQERRDRELFRKDIQARNLKITILHGIIHRNSQHDIDRPNLDY